MLTFDLKHNGVQMPGATWEFAVSKGLTDAETATAARAALTARFNARIEAVRVELHSATAGKLTAYRVKEEIARDPVSASAGELAQIDAEAAARGTDRAGLFTIIIARADELRQAVLRLEVSNAAAKSLLSDAADNEASIETAWAAALAELDTAKSDAAALVGID